MGDEGLGVQPSKNLDPVTARGLTAGTPKIIVPFHEYLSTGSSSKWWVQAMYVFGVYQSISLLRIYAYMG